MANYKIDDSKITECYVDDGENISLYYTDKFFDILDQFDDLEDFDAHIKKDFKSSLIYGLYIIDDASDYYTAREMYKPRWIKQK